MIFVFTIMRDRYYDRSARRRARDGVGDQNPEG